ncbi:hypothetical protein Lalb_Chr03g0031421 [Lupinus albus]|uniref:Uncharacterized protein n=1 Tax=Lupinus albus TaxID=3870 RepID=A0A6A4QQP4_LUPAL|nr:hypothetical protein Lalb_Chr03g0031421 [Lupinus albus]
MRYQVTMMMTMMISYNISRSAQSRDNWTIDVVSGSYVVGLKVWLLFDVTRPVL